MSTSIRNILAYLLVCFLISGCPGGFNTIHSAANGALQLVPEGATAISSATSRIDNLHMAVMEVVPFGEPLALGGVPVIWGPGHAWFEGDLLVSYRDDANTAGLQGGFGRGLARLVAAELSEGGVSVDQNNAQYVSWGRYNFQLIQGTGLLSPRTISYALGRLTPVLALPTTGLVYYDSIVNNVNVPATLAVQWGGATTKIGANIGRIIAGTEGDNTRGFNILTSGGLDESTIANSELALVPGTATFSGANIPATCITINCRASIKGFFAGPNAENAGLTFVVADQADALNIQKSGSIGFATRSSQPATSPPPSGGSGGGSGAFTAPLDTSSLPLAMVYAGPAGGLVDQSTDVTAITQDGTTGLITSYTKTGIDTFINNTAQGADLGGDALITWGRWTNGTSQMLGTGGPPSDNVIGAEQGFHYVIGKPSPSLPATGTANFTLLGSTKPTFGDGALPAGTLASAAMAVEWGGTAATKVGVNMTVTMPGDASYQIVTTGGTATPGTSEISTGGDARFIGFSIPVTGGARACNGGACEAFIRGLFTGTDGARAGLVYTVKPAIGPPNASISIVGAATFTKQ